MNQRQPENEHTTQVHTPNYVLLFDKQKIGPSVIDSEATAYGVVVYGFTDEVGYRAFMANSQKLLMPYPLVKTYLRDQLSDHGTDLKLVVVDAAGPQELQVKAVTMQAVLNALEAKSTHMTATHDLEYVPADDSYRVKCHAA